MSHNTICRGTFSRFISGKGKLLGKRMQLKAKLTWGLELSELRWPLRHKNTIIRGRLFFAKCHTTAKLETFTFIYGPTFKTILLHTVPYSRIQDVFLSVSLSAWQSLLRCFAANYSTGR
jgi:hypothetical protein